MRAALYARYSTGNQSPLSIDDQLRLGRDLAAQMGAHVVREEADAEFSGFSAARPGLARLLDLVRAGGCDVVIAEHSDRLARDGEKSWAVFNLLRDARVRYVTVQEGEVTIVHQGVSSLVSELKGEEVRQRTRRGLRGVVEAGRSAGGLTYGYRKVRAYDDAGEPLRGLLEIDPAQADVVRRIFRDYAAGASPQAIGHTLNREGVPGPRGGTWNASTIHGNAQRGTGVIHNELYVGVRVWGRRTFVKDRATGARRGLDALAPAVRLDVPELRIVPEDLWMAARARYASVATGPMGEGVRGRRRPRRLLEGLIVCGLCDRPMRRSGPGLALRCATRIEKGTCANGRTPGYPGVEARVVAAIKANLLHPDVIAHAVKLIQDGFREARRGAAKRQAKTAGELAEIDRRLERLVDQVEAGAPWSALEARHQTLTARRDQLVAEASAEPEADPIVELHPSAGGKYRQLVADLAAALDEPQDAETREGREAVRGLIQAVRLTPAEGHGKYDLEILGDLAPLLMLSAQEKAPREGGLSFAQVRPQLKGELGAGTGFEPVTFRL